MSIETLLEAARFLELQALQQQKTREENELLETLRLKQEVGKHKAEVPCYAPRACGGHVTSAEGSSPAHRQNPAPGLAPPPPPPPPLPTHSIPITVIPISMVPTNPSSATPAARLTPPRKDPHSPPAHHALQQSTLPSNQTKAAPTSLAQSSGAQLLQPFPGSIVTTSQHAVLPQAGPPAAQPSPAVRSSPLDDHRSPDSKKRPGGAGTREVHNKLEKNRRAHLKECFETLKKNIPNIDEKKTSNLSVLRSALRYIQTLKRKEKEYEHEMERLAREKISMQQKLAELKNELSQWMDVMEMDRALRQTIQPEDDQASTSTASEGEDNVNDDDDVDQEDLSVPGSHAPLPEPKKPQAPQHASIPPAPSQPPLPPAPAASAPVQPSTSALSPTPAQALAALPLRSRAVAAPPSLPPAHTHIVAAAGLQPSVIAHAAAAAAASHASVIQAVNHVVPAGTKHVAHIASSSSSPAQLAHGPQPIKHIAVHPVAHLGQTLPALYPQPVTVAQPAVMNHVAHALAQGHVNGPSTPGSQAAALVAKQATQVVTHHPQLVGQTVLNPVTMVTMPSFPVSTLKLA